MNSPPPNYICANHVEVCKHMLCTGSQLKMNSTVQEVKLKEILIAFREVFKSVPFSVTYNNNYILMLKV